MGQNSGLDRLNGSVKNRTKHPNFQVETQCRPIPKSIKIPIEAAIKRGFF